MSKGLVLVGTITFGCLGKEGGDLIDQVAASIVGGTDALSLARKGVCKERLFQIISVTTRFRAEFIDNGYL